MCMHECVCVCLVCLFAYMYKCIAVCVCVCGLSYTECCFVLGIIDNVLIVNNAMLASETDGVVVVVWLAMRDDVLTHHIPLKLPSAPATTLHLKRNIRYKGEKLRWWLAT